MEGLVKQYRKLIDRLDDAIDKMFRSVIIKSKPIEKQPEEQKLTPAQIAEIKNIYNRKNCAYCGWMKAALSWWCTNQKAIDYRGTSFPGINHCIFWKPDKDYIREHLNELLQSKSVPDGSPGGYPSQSKTSTPNTINNE